MVDDVDARRLLPLSDCGGLSSSLSPLVPVPTHCSRRALLHAPASSATARPSASMSWRVGLSSFLNSSALVMQIFSETWQPAPQTVWLAHRATANATVTKCHLLRAPSRDRTRPTAATAAGNGGGQQQQEASTGGGQGWAGHYGVPHAHPRDLHRTVPSVPPAPARSARTFHSKASLLFVGSPGGPWHASAMEAKRPPGACQVSGRCGGTGTRAEGGRRQRGRGASGACTRGEHRMEGGGGNARVRWEAGAGEGEPWPRGRIRVERAARR